MNYRYKEIRANSDDTWNWDIIGEFPVKFVDFFNWVLKNEKSFRIEFGASNKCYGGWLGNRLEVYKEDNGECYWTGQEPEDWFNEIANRNITKCWANGGWGQRLYICTFEED